MRYFIYEPDYCDTTYFDNKEAFDKAIDDFDFLGIYCDGAWSESVENVIGGAIPDGVEIDEDELCAFFEKYATHKSVETVLHKLDENGNDETGEHWGDYTHISTWDFKEI